ncbi:MAG: site-specific DNA-methyltransferase [Candidatus Lokiarchaeota archaeon]|nr:site-specific DNA-methyltransferase [Candidatus Lokiarchaeota archaeon]
MNSNRNIPLDTIKYEDCIIGMRSLSERSVDLVVADPPFGIDFSDKESLYNRNSNLILDGYEEVSRIKYSDFTSLWIHELPRIMKNTASAYIFSGWTNLKEILEAIGQSGLFIINHIIWKYQFGVFTKRKFVTSHYHILFCVKNPKKYFFNKIEHYPEDVWIIPRRYRPGQSKNNTRLPDEVVSRCIHFSSRPGDVVFDPFLGNGTTAVCAIANFRHYFGFEINKNMKEIIEKSLSETDLGRDYIPYTELLPSLEELAEKYPAVKKRL